jgi:exodeoxyribonuclease V alpha subunit
MDHRRHQSQRRPPGGRSARYPDPARHLRRRSGELAHATTTHRAQGETVDNAHFPLGEATGAAAYLATTRGRHNTARLVAGTTDHARAMRDEILSRGRGDL